jgi:hypothetical protein
LKTRTNLRSAANIEAAAGHLAVSRAFRPLALSEAQRDANERNGDKPAKWLVMNGVVGKAEDP